MIIDIKQTAQKLTGDREVPPAKQHLHMFENINKAQFTDEVVRSNIPAL